MIVLRQDDIRDVLSRPADFELGAVAEHKMLMGPFLLGLDPWPFYSAAKFELTAVLDNHHERARALAAENSTNAHNGIEQRVAWRTRQIDLIEDFAIPALSRTAQDLTGVTPPEVHHLAHDVPDVFEAVTRIVGSVVAVEQPAPFGLQWAGEATAADFRIHLDRLIDTRWRDMHQNAHGAVAPENILDELIANASEQGQRGPCPESVAQVRAKVAGLTLAAITPILKAYAHTIEQLLRRREWVIGNQPALTVAVEAATDARAGEVGSIIVEALRFHPVFPVLQRYAPRDTVIASGLDREYRVPGGTNVVEAVLPADAKEPFGFTDGISQPLVEGLAPAPSMTRSSSPVSSSSDTKTRPGCSLKCPRWTET